MLAWYVEWRLREAWRPLPFADCDLEEDAPAQRFQGTLYRVGTGRIAGLSQAKVRLQARGCHVQSGTTA